MEFSIAQLLSCLLSAGYPDALSPTDNQDKPGLVNFAREAGTKITTSGFNNPTKDTRKNLADGKLVTRWSSQRDGDKWVEFEFASPRTIIPWASRITDAIDCTAMEVDYVRIYRRKP